MPAVEYGVVPTEPVPAVNIPVTVDKPHVAGALFVLQNDIRAVCHAGLYNEIFAQYLGHIAVLRVVFEELVAVGIGQLAEILEVPFHVEVQPFGQIKLKS